MREAWQDRGEADGEHRRQRRRHQRGNDDAGYRGAHARRAVECDRRHEALIAVFWKTLRDLDARELAIEETGDHSGNRRQQTDGQQELHRPER